jgi:hypothetical protein
MNFQDFKNQIASEKIVLATVDASKRLMGWEVHSGSVYKITGINFAVITAVEDSGTIYTEAASIAMVTAGKYYLDRSTETLYIRTTSSDNPNGRFIVVTFRNFFANTPITLPHDLDSEFEVFWEPLIKSNSAFGVEIDTINQTSEAIEGSGSLTLHNDQDFWPTHFDKLTFENKDVSIYSFNRNLDASEAMLLFKGRVEKKSYTSKTIVFNLKDTLAELKAPVALEYISDLAERNSPSVDRAFQRMIFGRVYGFRPTNIDEVNEGYPLTGTVSVTNGSSTVTGSSTTFLAELSKDDEIVIDGVSYTIGVVSTNTSLELTEEYSGLTATGASATVIPEHNKRWINRVWKVAGHPVCQPTTTTLAGSTVTRIYVNSTAGMYPGDDIYVGTLGSGELATINRVTNANLITLVTSLATAPLAGVTVTRPAVQNVRINDLKLIYYRDYTFDATEAVLTLRDTAEGNAAPLRRMNSSLTFVNGSRTVTGTGLDTIFEPGYLVGVVTQTEMFEVLDVSETSLTLRTAATYNATATGSYKSLIFGADNTLSCDVLGRTTTGASSGALISDGPAIVKQLLTDLNLSSIIDNDSFINASEIASQEIGIVIPEKYSETKQPTYRETINLVNKSIMGSLVQTEAFNLSYLVLRPKKTDASLRLREEDILDFSITTDAQNMVKTVITQYRPKEYDYLTGEPSVATQQTSSDRSTYVLKTDKTKTFATKLVNQSDAEIYCGRWMILLEQTSGLIKLRTKLQGAEVEVGDIIDLSHRKLFVRFSGTDKRRIVMVEKVTKNGREVQIEAVDLSNCFNRVACITESETSYDSATDEEKLYAGYFTDDYGMIDNDPDTFGSNIIF